MIFAITLKTGLAVLNEVYSINLRWVTALLLLCGMVPADGADSTSWVIDGVTVIDGTGAPAKANMQVVVRDGRIAYVSASKQHWPRSMKRIDGRGKFLIPGMMDLHIHLLGGGAWRDSSAQSGKPLDFDLGIATLQGYLYYGFTSVYDAGNNPDFILPLRQRERAGEIVSPRIFATGQLLSYPGSWSVGYAGIGVRDWPATIQDLEIQAARRPDLQKITYESFGVGPNPLIPSLPKDLMARIVEWFHARGVRTTVHISSETMARDAIAVGIDSFAHAPGVGVISRDFARLLAERQIPVQTSLSVFDEIMQLENGVDFLRTPEYAAVVDAREPEVRAHSAERYRRLGWPLWFKTVLPYAKRNLKLIHDAGGILALGTDRTFAPSALRELELVVDCGIAPIEVIKIATLNAARFLDRERDLGSIETGKLADMVLLSSDPTVDIRRVRDIVYVFKGGARIERDQLQLPINRSRR